MENQPRTAEVVAAELREVVAQEGEVNMHKAIALLCEANAILLQRTNFRAE